ncbi:MAG: hypothetical protein FWF38_02135 [Spirochaetaceae bacterium]|nr:hypothetical protein [Spirochaetaceae bacterium]
MKISIFAFVFFLVAAFAFSQSNEEMDLFMAKDKADIGTATAFVLAAAGVEVRGASAVEYINKNKWFKEEIKEGDSLRADYASYIIMKAFNQNGGIMYNLVKGPRYALKEMKYLKMVDQRKDPAAVLSGTEFMILLSEYLSWKEETL